VTWKEQGERWQGKNRRNCEQVSWKEQGDLEHNEQVAGEEQGYLLTSDREGTERPVNR
jgi:hypothetical protein